VKFKCGHTRPVARLAWARCPACQEAGRVAEAADRLRRREEKEVAAYKQRFRLPDNSLFVAEFDAARGVWSGTLTVPGAGSFSREEITVLQLIDRLGRDWYAATQEVGTGRLERPARPG
jgi:hypothetical protein